jgi:hypothetical protein
LRITALTRSRVVSRTLPSPLITRETVIGETPAAAATSLIVGVLRCRLERRLLIAVSGLTGPL